MNSQSQKTTTKTVLISGTSSGIGNATALLMAREGWIVFAGVRKQSDFDRLQESHPNICPVFLDVTKPDQIAKAIESIGEKVGSAGLTALVNNSGGAHAGPIEFVPIEDVEDEFQVNVFGAYRLSQAAIPLLRMGKGGRIINISSFLGTATMPFSSAYCASKYALESMTVCMRQELAPMGISVSALGAGPVKTNFGNVVTGRLQKILAEGGKNEQFEALYAENMNKMQKIFESAGAVAASSETVARQVKRMLTTWWLRRRYCDTYVTWFSTLFFAFMPSWLTEWLIRLTVF